MMTTRALPEEDVLLPVDVLHMNRMTTLLHVLADVLHMNRMTSLLHVLAVTIAALEVVETLELETIHMYASVEGFHPAPWVAATQNRHRLCVAVTGVTASIELIRLAPWAGIKVRVHPVVPEAILTSSSALFLVVPHLMVLVMDVGILLVPATLLLAPAILLLAPDTLLLAPATPMEDVEVR